MKRFVRAAAVAAIAASGAGSVGCVHTDGAPKSHDHGDGAKYRNWVDTSYPERYNAAARQETLNSFAGQIYNGQVMNQTLWNWHFEMESVTDPVTGKVTVKPTAKLNGAGRAKLDSIARSRPAPDTRVYIQAARDVPLVGDKVDDARAERETLTAKRGAAVQSYLAAMPSVNQMAYEVIVHDATPPAMPAEFARFGFSGQRQGYTGGLTAGGGTAALNTGSGGLQQPAQPTSNTSTTNSTNTNINASGSGGSTGGTGTVGPNP